MTLIAVSILNYNSAVSTVACVESLLRADHFGKDEYELAIFVADNASEGSEGETLEHMLSGLPGVRFIANSENLGFAAGHNRNLGYIFAELNPDYVWLLNNDCEVDERAVSELLKSARANPDVGVWGATLLESDGRTIQCAGGCFYNSWFSTYRRFGRGKAVDQRHRLKNARLDYIAGASLFFPAATLSGGLEQPPVLPGEPLEIRDRWLNEAYFLYFEELDLVRRLKPGHRIGWCRDALIKHEGGLSVGTQHRRRSAPAEYHSTLSALKYTYFYHPGRLWFVRASRYLLKSVLLVFILHLHLLKSLSQAYRDFGRWLSDIRRSVERWEYAEPLITIVVPSLNQGRFLNDTLSSIFAQDLPVEVFVMDGGSTDNSLEVIRRWEHRLAGWRSHPDRGQSAAINEGVARGSAPYVCWLNSDDFFYPNGLKSLLHMLQRSPQSQFSYGRCWTVSEKGNKISPYITVDFRPRLFASFCFIAQPATLVTRKAWEDVGGLDESMDLAFDYDLWWRLYGKYGEPAYCREFVASTRMHPGTKTANQTAKHYQESIEVVERYWGTVPIKWNIGLPVIKMFRRLST